MVLLHEISPSSLSIIGEQQKSENEKYRKAVWVIEQDVNSGRLLYNVLTKELLYLSDSYSEDNNIIDLLIKKYYYVPNHLDECEFVDSIRDIYLLTEKGLSGYSGYTILTTTDCNARCFYCYEKGQERRTMTVEMANKVADYILKTKCEKEKILLSWFGGEPLYNNKVIDIICDILRNNGVNYDSSMISNGFLFDEIIVKRAVENWNLKNVQITLDGQEKTYNKVKSFVYGDNVNAYKKVVSNIGILLNSNINVSVRLNIGLYNVSEIDKLIDELASLYMNSKKMQIYTSPLFQELDTSRDKTQRAKLLGDKKKLDDKLNQLGLGRVTVLPKEPMYKKCMADSDNSVVILPDGFIGKCTSYTDSNYIGHIDKHGFDEKMLAKYSKRRKKLKECSSCPIYSLCIRLEMCREKSEYCFKEYREYSINDYKQAMLNEYHAFLEREKENANKEYKVS